MDRRKGSGSGNTLVAAKGDLNKGLEMLGNLYAVEIVGLLHKTQQMH